jgi:hypothetical protein
VSRKTYLTIDRLVLHGFSAAQRETVVNGFQTELARLLDGGGFGDSQMVPALRLAPHRNGGTGPGEAAARQLFQGLRR